MDAETKFFIEKLNLDYGDKRVVGRLKNISKKISWLKGWPEDKKAFWNGEAFMWGNKISKEKRELIKEELIFLAGKENLDLGCGSYSYVYSVGLDISERMLLLNENLSEQVVGDLEKKLPLERGRFDSVSMVFVLDYVRNYKGLLEEIFRVLKERGKLIVVQGKGGWREQVVNSFGFKRWKRILEGAGFKVKFYEKGGLGFFKGEKRKII